MKKYRILPELKTRNYRDKVFLYNPWSDNAFELNSLSWNIALGIGKDKTPKSLALELGKKWQKDYKTILQEIEKLQKELIKWEILTTR